MLSRALLPSPLALLFVAAILLCPMRALAQPAQCGDLNDSGSVSTADALLLLKGAVGQNVDLICDQCGSTCPGDPLYLLGQWFFESEFVDTIYEDNYALYAVDEVCDVVGQDLDDLGFVYGYTGSEYDYVLIDHGGDYCDVFVFDYIGPNDVEGFDVLVDLDLDGFCDLDAPYDEGLMIGFRAGSSSTAVTAALTASTMVGPVRSKPARSDDGRRVALDSKVAAELQFVKQRYEGQRRR